MKKITSVALIFVILLSVFGILTVNANEEGFIVKNFGCFDANGSPVYAVNSASPITIKARLQRTNVSATKATIIAAIYDGAKLNAVASETRNFPFMGGCQDYAVTVTPIGDITGGALKFFMWDDMSRLRPLNAYADISSSNAQIDMIYVNGKPLEGFDPEAAEQIYSFTFPASAYKEPEVYAKCSNFATNVDVQREADRIVLTATAPSGASKQYVINTTRTEAAVSAISASYQLGGTTKTIEPKLPMNGPVVHNPIYQYDDEGNIQAFGSNYWNLISNVYQDRPYWYITNAPDELIGYNTIGYKYDDRGCSDMVTTFTVNKSVRMFFTASPSQATSYGYKRRNLSSKLTVLEVGPDWNAVTNRIPDPVGDVNQPTFSYEYLYYTDFIVPEGESAKTFELHHSPNGIVPVLFYKFIEDTGVQVSDVSVSYIKDNAETTETINTFNVLKKPDYKYDADNQPIPFGNSGAAVWGAQPPILTQIFTDSYKYVKTFPEEMNGATNIRFKRAHGTANYGDEFTLTFTINRSATLYFDSDDAHIAEYGAEKMESGIGYDETDNWYDAIANHIPKPDTTESLLHGGRLYKMQLMVPEGEESATFTVVLCNSKPWDGPIAFIK